MTREELLAHMERAFMSVIREGGGEYAGRKAMDAALRVVEAHYEVRKYALPAVAGGAFQRFWRAWPHKVGKPAAEKAFKKVAGEIDAILAGVERYIRDKPADRQWLNPSTFLNQRRWEDEPAPVAAQIYDLRKDGVALVLNQIRRVENESRQAEIAGANVHRMALLPAERGPVSGNDGDISRCAEDLFG